MNTVKLCECGVCGLPAPIAKRTITCKGHVKGQPIRFIKGHRRLHLAGQRFGRWLVLPQSHIRRAAGGNVRMFCKCLCDCGVTKFVSAARLKSGGSKSCGCLRFDTTSNLTHGMSRTPEYEAYCAAVQRCTNPSNNRWEAYGARGIKVLLSFEEFFAEIGLRPEGVDYKGKALYSLDRWPDPDGNYESGNIRWATREQQKSTQRFHGSLGRRGESGYGSKLTNKQAKDIRIAYAAGGTSMPILSREYGVVVSTIHSIIRGRTFQNIEAQPLQPAATGA